MSDQPTRDQVAAAPDRTATHRPAADTIVGTDGPAEMPSGLAGFAARLEASAAGGTTGESPAARDRAATGVAVPGYEVEGELGRGGMGVVYKARHVRLNRTVALKMVLDGKAGRGGLIRFLAEAEAVAAVEHPNVVRVYEYGEHAGHPYMALEYLPGGTLADVLDRPADAPAGSARFRALVPLVAQVARGVAAAHALGIVHRDLKPANVLLDETGRPKVTDFGLAKRGGGADLTATEAVMGTPAYMSPEQADGKTKFVGPPADVWALGVILYECLTGARPFAADDMQGILSRVLTADPVPPRGRDPSVPRDLELICLKCLSKAPHERYPTAHELADDLEAFAAGRPISVRPAGPVERAAKWVRRNKAVTGAVAAVIGLLLTCSAVVGLYAVQADRALARAKQAEAEKDEQTLRNKVLVQKLLRFIASDQELTDDQHNRLVADFLRSHPEYDSHDYRRAVKPEPRNFEGAARGAGAGAEVGLRSPNLFGD